MDSGVEFPGFQIYSHKDEFAFRGSMMSRLQKKSGKSNSRQNNLTYALITVLNPHLVENIMTVRTKEFTSVLVVERNCLVLKQSSTLEQVGQASSNHSMMTTLVMNKILILERLEPKLIVKNVVHT